MNELLKWALILGGGYIAYNWFVNSQSGQVAPGPGSLTPSSGTPATPAIKNVQASNLLSDIAVTNAPPGFSRTVFGMGRYNYLRTR